MFYDYRIDNGSNVSIGTVDSSDAGSAIRIALATEYGNVKKAYVDCVSALSNNIWWNKDVLLKYFRSLDDDTSVLALPQNSGSTVFSGTIFTTVSLLDAPNKMLASVVSSANKVVDDMNRNLAHEKSKLCVKRVSVPVKQSTQAAWTINVDLQDSYTCEVDLYKLVYDFGSGLLYLSNGYNRIGYSYPIGVGAHNDDFCYF